MKKPILASVICLLTLNICYSQSSLQWAKQSEGDPKVISMDDSGNVIVAGNNYHWLPRSKTIKYRPDGLIMWTLNNSETIGIDALVTDPDGNIYQTSRGPGTPLDEFDIVTEKISPSGTVMWSKFYDYPAFTSTDEISASILIDSHRNIIVSGNGNGPSLKTDYLILKYDSAGTLLWSRRYDDSLSHDDDRILSSVLDENDNVYVTGQSFKAGQGYDIVTIKYSPNGDMLWMQRYNGPGNSEDTPKIIVYRSGSVYLCGFSLGSSLNADFITIKYSTDGAENWAQRFEFTNGATDIAYSLGVSETGDVYVTGTRATIKYSPSGILQWVRNFSGKGLALDNYGCIYITDGVGRDLYVRKFSPSGDNTWTQFSLGQCYTIPFYCDNRYGINLVTDGNNNVYTLGVLYTGFGGGHWSYFTLKFQQEQMNILNTNLLVQGFYNSQTNSMIRDTVVIVLRKTVAPFDIAAQSKAVIDSAGNGAFYFYSVQAGEYYMVIKHRNSIETWSNPVTLDNTMNYSFSGTAGQAFGDNQILVDDSPIKYAVYGGDVNHDGYVDNSDQLLVYNDVINFANGYLNSDVTGNNITDLTDLLLVSNNASDFVQVRKP